jgi:hypothetical protein
MWIRGRGGRVGVAGVVVAARVVVGGVLRGRIGEVGRRGDGECVRIDLTFHRQVFSSIYTRVERNKKGSNR